MQPRDRQMHEHTKVMRAFQQGRRLGSDLLPIRFFGRNNRAAILLLGLALRRTLQLTKLAIEFEIGSSRRVSVQIRQVTGQVEWRHLNEAG